MQPVTIRSYEFHCNFVTSASVVVTRAKPLIAARWFAARSLMKDKCPQTHTFPICAYYMHTYITCICICILIHASMYTCVYIYICVLAWVRVQGPACTRACAYFVSIVTHAKRKKDQCMCRGVLCLTCPGPVCLCVCASSQFRIPGTGGLALATARALARQRAVSLRVWCRVST